MSISFDPEEVRPFPKATTRKLIKRSQNRRRSAILTDTQKGKIEEAEAVVNRNVKPSKPTIMKKKISGKSHKNKSA